jgi:hypothetical protein
VLIAVHSLCHCRDLRHVGIGCDCQQIVVAPQPPQQSVENGKTLGSAVQDRGLRQLDEFGGDVEGAVWSFKRCGGRRGLEQFGLVALHHPCHIGGFYSIQGQRSRRFTPAFEIGFAIECDEVHVHLSTFSPHPPPSS